MRLVTALLVSGIALGACGPVQPAAQAPGDDDHGPDAALIVDHSSTALPTSEPTATATSVPPTATVAPTAPIEPTATLAPTATLTPEAGPGMQAELVQQVLADDSIPEQERIALAYNYLVTSHFMERVVVGDFFAYGAKLSMNENGDVTLSYDGVPQTLDPQFGTERALYQDCSSSQVYADTAALHHLAELAKKHGLYEQLFPDGVPYLDGSAKQQGLQDFGTDHFESLPVRFERSPEFIAQLKAYNEAQEAGTDPLPPLPKLDGTHGDKPLDFTDPTQVQVGDFLLFNSGSGPGYQHIARFAGFVSLEEYERYKIEAPEKIRLYASADEVPVNSKGEHDAMPAMVESTTEQFMNAIENAWFERPGADGIPNAGGTHLRIWPSALDTLDTALYDGNLTKVVKGRDLNLLLDLPKEDQAQVLELLVEAISEQSRSLTELRQRFQVVDKFLNQTSEIESGPAVMAEMRRRNEAATQEAVGAVV